MPHLEKLSREMKAQGVRVITVNSGDEVALITRYARQQGFTFPILMEAKGKGNLATLYRVHGYPTTYLLNGTGKILWRSEGGGIAQIRKALKQAIPP